MERPLISIIMPVFNTGIYLVEAIDSVINQESIDGCGVPLYELIIVDDHSDDSQTLDILHSASLRDPRIRIVKNERKKGVAGARNTGILRSLGKWIGFLDSDDTWLPHALVERWRFILDNPEAKWVAAHFFLDKPDIGIEKSPLSKRSPILYAAIKKDYEAGQASCLERPVEMFAKNCMCLLQTSTVLIDRDLLLQKAMFNEQLRRAEDYHLWFKCALENNLWILPIDISIYRLRPGSLTRGNEPVFFYEDQMMELLIQDPTFGKYKEILRKRLDFVLSDYCYFYRKHKLYNIAFHWASAWVRKRPLNVTAWRQLVVSMLRV